MLGFLIDPQHAAYQVTVPVPSAEWLNTLGYFITNRFYFWFDDMWLDQIAAMAQRKIMLPIRIISQGEKGKTPRMKNLLFWNRYFASTIDDRLEDATKLLRKIHLNDQESFEVAMKHARETAAIQLHKLSLIQPESEKKTELKSGDLDSAPSTLQLLNYMETELLAVEDLLLKLGESIRNSELSDALFISDALEKSSYIGHNINLIKKNLSQEFKFIDSSNSHIDDKTISSALFNKIETNLTNADSCKERLNYMSRRLGIEDDYFIFFSPKIDEEPFFIIQGFLFYIQRYDVSLDSILVIGAEDGEGAVQAIVTAYKNISSEILFCIEPDCNNFDKLKNRYSKTATLYNCSSVSTDHYISKEKLTAFYKYIPSAMNQYPLERFISNLNKEVQYLNTTNRSVNCIMEIKQFHNLERFDLAILNGSLFTGEADLDAVYGSNFILLTSINSIKDYANHKKLLEDNNYVLLTHNFAPRTGYSFFRRRDY